MQVPTHQLLLLGVLSFCFSLPAHAVYKCEQDGKISYSETPCVAGKASQLVIAAPPTNAEKQQTKKDLARAKSNLSKLEKQRAKEDAQAAREASKQAAAAKRRDLKAEKCLKQEQNLRWAKEDAAHQTGSQGEAARKRTKRMQERYQLECPSVTGLQ